MTLERHRSNLIPAVDFGGDGRIFVTDRHGSFPLRSSEKPEKGRSKDIDWEGGYRNREHNRHKERDAKLPKDNGRLWEESLRPWEYDRDKGLMGDIGSYHSYDPKRERRKYKPKEVSNYERAVREVTGTVSSKSSNSLSRKVRRSKSHRSYIQNEGRFGGSNSGSLRMKSEGSVSSEGRRFHRGGVPRMPPEMAAREEFRRGQSTYRSLDVNALRRTQREMNNNYDNYASYKKSQMINGHGPKIIDDFDGYIPHLKKITEERLPFVIFIILGLLLIVLGIVRLLLSYWHEYFCLLWTGLVVLLLGLVGACHLGQYLNGAKNISYILLATLSAAATMSSAALILPVFVPTIQHIVRDTNITVLPAQVEFSNWNKTLIPVSLSSELMVYLSICLDIAGLLASCAGFASLTVMLIALDFYWEASYVRTGECDHKGNPKFFNPLEQMSLAQATMFLGLLIINLQMPEVSFYFSPVWAPFMLMIAGFTAVFFGKRPDLQGLGFLSIMIQIIAMLASGMATVLVTLGLVESITTLLSDALIVDYHKSEVIASMASAGVFILMMVVNIVFSVGIAFRNIRQMCCGECFEEDIDDAGYDTKSIKSDAYDIRL